MIRRLRRLVAHPRSGRSSALTAPFVLAWHTLPRALVATIALLALALLLSACDQQESRTGAQIEWRSGTPPGELAAVETPEPDAPLTDASAEADDVAAARQPTAEERQKLEPNELGMIPILAYHVFTTDRTKVSQFVHHVDDFRADLQWLYEHDFYVVPLRDVILNQIQAPAGKRPVVLTFDDSSAGQFRYLIAEDGSVTIDPSSAVGIMEEFFAAHPDFGRGGFFAVLPLPHFCFSWQLDESEPDQRPFCAQKLRWLVDNGYEIGNHTLNHRSLHDVDDDTFRAEVGGAIEAIQALVPDVIADILVMPFGDYPKLDTRRNQRTWLRNGFDYNGRQITLLGCLMVGSEPAFSPVSTEWDPIFIARIQGGTKDEYGYSRYWFSYFEANPDLLYTSDGNPDTITVPAELPPRLVGTLDEARIAAQGKELIRS